MSGSEYAGTPANGAGELTRDSLAGNFVNGGIFTLLAYVANAVGKFDVTALPDAIEPAVAGIIATGLGILTSKIMPKYKTRRAVR